MKVSNFLNNFSIEDKEQVSAFSKNTKLSKTSNISDINVITNRKIDGNFFKDKIAHLKKIDDVDMAKLAQIKEELNTTQITSERLADVILSKIK